MQATEHLHMYNPYYALLIPIAKLPPKRIHQIAKNLILPHKPKRQHIRQRHLRTRRAILQRRSAVNLVLAGREVHILPRGPDAVDHGVVEEEERVVGAGMEVFELGGPAAEPVAATVDAEFVVAEEALHEVLEAGDGGLAEDEVGDVCVGWRRRC